MDALEEAVNSRPCVREAGDVLDVNLVRNEVPLSFNMMLPNTRPKPGRESREGRRGHD
jgi:hypothetical protein